MVLRIYESLLTSEISTVEKLDCFHIFLYDHLELNVVKNLAT